MTLLSAWALAGLLGVAPLVIAHLRRESRQVLEVPSLLLWEDLEQRSSGRRRRLRLPRLPLLLALQALALALLVFALARPTSGAARPGPTRVYVIDNSLWMSADGRPAATEQAVARLARGLAPSAPVRLVVAGAAPRIAYAGPASGLARAARRITPSAAPTTLTGALTVAASLLHGPRDRVTVVRAPEDPLPTTRAIPGELSSITVGSPVADQGIFSPVARCGIRTATGCEVVAPVRNSASTTVTDHYTAYAGGTALRGSLRVPAASTGEIVLTARAGEQVRLALDVSDPLPADDQAWVTVPGAANVPQPQTVTLVGAPSDAVDVARAFAAVPGVSLRLRTPTSYRAADARASGLTILDGWLPPGGLPPSPAVLLVNPPRLPGGRVSGTLADSVTSGLDPTNGLLDGVDLTSLSINRGSARSLSLPPYMAAVAWSPSGPLLAAGDDGRQRVAALSFDPANSDLPQLSSFPVLAANLVRWSADWSPAAAPAGQPIRLDATPGARRLTVQTGSRTVVTRALRGAGPTVTLAQPGLYRITETGPGVRRTTTLPVSVAPPSAPASGPAVDLQPVPGATGAGHGGDGAVTWLLAAALAVLVLEWVYWRRRAPRLVAT